MRRGCSNPADMPKPNVQQQQQQPSVAGNRRTSEPGSFRRGIDNVGFTDSQQWQQASAGQGQNIPFAAAQPLNNMQWQSQHQQQRFLGQPANTRHHSYTASMDLMSHTASTSVANQSTANILFKSSSHRTAHTSVAGDLLTMSRRALNPPPPNQRIVTSKKRNSMSVHHFITNSNPQQPHIHAPQHTQGFPNDQRTSFFNGQESKNSTSPSTLGIVMADKKESCQEHRTIRQCRRSNSFEMMEDG